MKKTRKLISYKPAGKLSFAFESRVVLYDGPAAWYFLHLPVDLSSELDGLFAEEKRGFGSLPVIAEINAVAWSTSIFPDSSSRTYMLPLKSKVRKQAGIDAGDPVKVKIIINV